MANFIDVNPLALEALDRVRSAGLVGDKGLLSLIDVVKSIGWPGDSRSHQTAVAKALKAVGFLKVRVRNPSGSLTKHCYKYLHKDRVYEARLMASGSEGDDL